MERATVKVQYNNPPKEGKKMGSIKTPEGQTFWAYPNQLLQLNQGMTYIIDYESKPSNNGGNPFLTIKSILPHPDHPSNVRDVGAKPLPPKQLEATDRTAERIFVCGLMNGWAHSGKLPVDENAIVDAIDVARRAFNQTLGNDMQGDGIPY